MLKTKIAIVKWIIHNFVDEQEFSNFCEFAELHIFVKDGIKLTNHYNSRYNSLISERFIDLYEELDRMPEITIVERFEKATHFTERTPLNYILYFYGSDQKRRIELFKKKASYKGE